MDIIVYILRKLDSKYKIQINIFNVFEVFMDENNKN